MGGWYITALACQEHDEDEDEAESEAESEARTKGKNFEWHGECTTDATSEGDCTDLFFY